MNYTLRYHLPAFIGRCLARVFLRLEILGQENIPKQNPFLLICNHISHFDPPLLGIAVPHYLAWVVAADLYVNTLLRNFFNLVKAIPINRQIQDRRAVKEILTRIKHQESVGLFPEGGIRFGKDSLIHGKAMDETVGAISHLTQIPILPAVILGSDKLYHPKAWFKKTTIYLAFGPPIFPSQFLGESALIRNQLNQSTVQSIQNLFLEIKEKFQLTERDLPMSFEARWAGV